MTLTLERLEMSFLSFSMMASSRGSRAGNNVGEDPLPDTVETPYVPLAAPSQDRSAPRC